MSRETFQRFLVGLVALLALALRLLGAERVFVEDGVAFYVGDAYFHVYQALASLHRFPGFLGFDPYLNFPSGATVPSPPGYDLLVAGVTLLLGGGDATLERVAALLPAVLGAATVFPVYALGVRASGPRVGLAAAFLVAALPANAVYSIVGYADHHAAVTFLAACWLATAAAIADEAPDRPALWLRGAALWILRTVLVATWSGSLLYLALADVSLVLALVVLRTDAASLGVVALSLAATALSTAPLVAAAPEPLGGALSTISLSWLQPLACAALAAWAAILALRAARAPSRALLRRIGEALALGAVLLGVLLAAPAIRTNVASGLAFVAKHDAWGEVVIEQLPLFSRLPGAIPATMLFGWLAWLLPIAPLFAIPVLRTPASRGTGLLLLVWGAALGGLTLTQNRYACDASPVAAVLFALGIAHGAAATARRLRLSAGVERLAVAIACALLLVPSITQFHAPRALATLRWAAGREQGRGDRALATVHGTALRFAHEVRRATPETAGFQGEAGSPPEYGVVCEPSLGYVVQYAARRPTPASNAGPYVGAENVAAVQRLLAIGTEPEVVAIAEHLHARYVMTAARPNYGPRTTLFRLHALDGAGRGDAPRWERLRLVTEGPAGGTPFAALLGGAPPSWGHVPYKLFEVVAGAVLEVPAQPGQRVAARAAIETPTERTFVYAAEAIADDDGRARIRVPYATETDAPARPIGPWRITSGDVVYHATLRDSDVETGATVVIDPASAERW